MPFASNGASRGLRWGIATLSAASILIGLATDPADARGRHRRAKHTYQKQSSYSPPSAAIVVDANSGRVLHASNADNLRHPASITKIMTLYLLFEQIEAGKLRLDSQLPVSAHAASQAPSKLGLKPGQTIAVEDAIKALVTKSANDVAAVVGEAIGGDEDEFAKLMTAKAQALGMSRTVYGNASGLPNDEQVTTARDQALLGRAIQDRFPRYYRYFATSSFYYRGQSMRNHNHLLGRVAGVDGIKTGYIRASGFNLVTSVKRGNRHLVVVVLGGASAGARDARVRALIEEYVGQGAPERTAARIVESGTAQARAKPAAAPAVALQMTPTDPAQSPPDPARPESVAIAAPARPAPGSSEPISAIPVRTLTVRTAAPSQNAAMAALSMAALGPAPAPAAPVAQYQTASASSVPVPAPTKAVAPPSVPRQASIQATSEPAPQPAAVAPAPKAQSRAGWIIQIGAFPDESEARERLNAAQSLGKGVLGKADPFTERVSKGKDTLYRARFAGMDEQRAEAACRYFKRNKIDCFAVKN
jgi:D-alanyl-D-alanine carboxypeptidase